MLTLAIEIGLFIFGAAIGSFISVLIYRIHAKKRGIFQGRSACQQCETKLAPLDLIPIASFLVLRGKCRYCSKDISYMYPLLELVSGALFVLLFFKFPFANSALQFSGNLLGLYLLHAFYAGILIFTFFYDLKYLKVADEILLPGILIGLIATLMPGTPLFIDALLGAALSLAFFGIQILVSRGEWVGYGDLRVGAFMGVILGWKLMIVALFLSYFVGSFVAVIIALRKKKFMGVKIPFAPMLVTGTLLALFFGNDLLEWYLGGMGVLN